MNVNSVKLDPTSPALRRAGAALLSVAALLASQSCGDAKDGTAAPDGAPTSRDVTSFCDALCDYGERCPRDLDPADEPQAPCRQDCSQQLRRRAEAGLFQRQVVQALRDCYSALSCAGSDEGCLRQVAEQLALDIDTPLARQCLEVQDECGGFSDDVCAFAATATNAGMARLEDCLSSACGAVGACIATLIE